jgi:hypothetical protein
MFCAARTFSIIPEASIRPAAPSFLDIVEVSYRLLTNRTQTCPGTPTSSQAKKALRR